MASLISQRKSGRASKKPEFFQFSDPQRENSHTDADDIDEDQNDFNSDEDPPNATPVEKKRKMKAATAVTVSSPDAPPAAEVKQKAKKSKKGKGNVSFEGVDPADLDSDSIFGLVKNGKDLRPCLETWMKSFKSDRVSAMVDLVNFILASSGATKSWIQRDVDLDALEPEELDELLSDMIKELDTNEGGVQFYPLHESNKKGKKQGGMYRQHYIQFWEKLTEKLLAMMQSESQPSNSVGSSNSSAARGSALDILRVVSDQLIALSSMSVVNIRDAVTEAVLTMGHQLIIAVLLFGDQIAAIQRQISAEEASKTSRTSSISAKYQAYAKQKSFFTKITAELNNLVTNIFNSVLVHRIKDSQDSLRVLCAKRLTQWLLANPQTYFKDDYFKYYGWMTYDKSEIVRREAIFSIGEFLSVKEHQRKMANFLERFTDRFVQISSSDTSHEVALEALFLLRKLQQNGMLDHATDEQLDHIDRVTFDRDAVPRVRLEALSFFMDHTEGFEELEGGDPNEKLPNSQSIVTQNKTKSTKRGASSAGGELSTSQNEDKRILARRQRNAIQLETLAEYAEHHLGDNHFAEIDLLAEACLSLNNYSLLYDWSTMLSLLLTEHDEIISTTLRPSLISIVLRFFVHSSTQLRSLFREPVADTGINNSNALDHHVSTGTSKKRIAKTSATPATAGPIAVSAWTSLNYHLSNSALKLLTRFKDDAANLIALLKIVECLDVSGQPKVFQSLLKFVGDLLDSTIDAGLIEALVNLLHSWIAMGGSYKGSVETFLKKSLVVLLDQVQDSILAVKDVASKNDLPSSFWSNSGETSRRTSKKRESNAVGKETFHTCNITLMRLSFFWKVLDCRDLIEVNADTFVDDMIELSDALVSAYDRHTVAIKENKLDDICLNANRGTLRLVFLVLLWFVNDVYRKMSDRGSSDEDDRVQVSEIGPAVEAILSIREKLIDALMTWMSFGYSDDNAGAPSQLTADPLYRCLQREAFRLVCDLRGLFQMRLSTCLGVDALALAPSQDLLAKMRYVFETESRRINNEREQWTAGTTDTPKDSTTVESTAVIGATLAKDLINSLRKALCFDMDNLNRRQAAALIAFLVHADESVQEVVKLLMKRLKDADIVKYLEIQLITLKNYYLENVSEQLKSILYQDDDQAHNDEEFLELNEMVSNGLANFNVLAKRLANSLGVGKLKSGLPLATLGNFLKLGIDFAMSEAQFSGFLEGLSPFVKFLPQQQVALTAAYFDEVFNNQEPLMLELESSPVPILLDIVNNFSGHLHGEDTTATTKLNRSATATQAVAKSQRRKPIASQAIARVDEIVDEDVDMDVDMDEEPGSDDGFIEAPPRPAVKGKGFTKAAAARAGAKALTSYSGQKRAAGARHARGKQAKTTFRNDDDDNDNDDANVDNSSGDSEEIEEDIETSDAIETMSGRRSGRNANTLSVPLGLIVEDLDDDMKPALEERHGASSRAAKKGPARRQQRGRKKLGEVISSDEEIVSDAEELEGFPMDAEIDDIPIPARRSRR